MRREYVILNGIPVHFLVPYNPLVEEAVKKSVRVVFDDVRVKIMPLEYLMAIMIQTSRHKDKARLEDIEKLSIKYNHNKFKALLKQHGLGNKWKKIKESFH